MLRGRQVPTTLFPVAPGLFSVAVAVYHLAIHQAPLLPTVLGQWLLLAVAGSFLLSVFWVSQAADTPDEQAVVAVRVCAAYVFGAAVSLAYASHQYFTPLAEVGADTVFFEAVFTGSALGIAGSVIGRTALQYERALAEAEDSREELANEQALTESIFDALPDIFYAFDDEGNFFEWNDQFPAVTGYTDEEVESMSPTDLIVAEDRAKVAEAIGRVFERGESMTIEAQLETEAGERIPYEFTGSKIVRSDGESLGLVGIGRDISQLKQQRQRFRAVFDNTYQFIGLLTTDGDILEINDTALEFGGLDREQVVGEKLWEAHWFQTNDGARASAREAVQTANDGALYREEVTVQGADDTEVIDFSVRPITDGDGETVLLVPEGRPITGLKEREQHLRVLHRFLRHNLRNKMTVIQGTASTLRRTLSEAESGSGREEHVARIEDAAAELTELSETARELSQVAIDDTEERYDIAARRVLESARESVVENYPSATISIEVEADVHVQADWRLENVFEQLLENAVEHADHEAPVVAVDAEHEGDRVAIRVADDGPGIPSDELAGIVTDEEPTQLTHGTGFGLWLARSVVDDYTGELDHESRPGGGSVMSVELPAADAEEARLGEHSGTSEP